MRLAGLAWRAFLFFLFLRKQMGGSQGGILRNSDQNLKQSEAYSAASLPAGPEVHCFTGTADRTRPLPWRTDRSSTWQPARACTARAIAKHDAAARTTDE